MGYTTDFSGKFDLNKELSPKMKQYLTLFNETRRMKRNTDEVFGVQGEFYVFGGGSFGQDHEPNIIDFNKPPTTQPSLWNQWTPTQDGMGIEWDGGEKFNSYTEWLVYLIHKILAPNGYILNGVVQWQGEENGDVGEIIVENNRVFTQEWKGEKTEMTPQNATNMNKFTEQYGDCFGHVEQKNFMRTDVVLILEGTDTELPKPFVGLLENN
jgi:hypothetical protein